MRTKKREYMILLFSIFLIIGCSTTSNFNREVNESAEFIGEYNGKNLYINNFFGFTFNLFRTTGTNFVVRESNLYPVSEVSNLEDDIYFEIQTENGGFMSNEPSFYLSIGLEEKNIATPEQFMNSLYIDFKDESSKMYKTEKIPNIENVPYYEEYIIESEFINSYSLIIKQGKYFIILSMIYENETDFEFLNNLLTCFTFYSNDIDWNTIEIKTTLSGDFYNDYINLIQQNRFDELLILLESWENSEPNNPELYIALYNYHIRKSRNSGMKLSTTSNNDEQLAITNKDTNEIIGYLYNSND